MYISPKKQKRELEKVNEELLELHKRVLKDYLITHKAANLKTRNRFFRLYNIFINEDNIREYFFKPASIFIQALVKDQLVTIQDIHPKIKKHGKRNKSAKL